jgi:hypothetical protein
VCWPIIPQYVSVNFSLTQIKLLVKDLCGGLENKNSEFLKVLSKTRLCKIQLF